MTLGEFLGSEHDKFILREINNYKNGFKLYLNRSNGEVTFMRFANNVTESNPYYITQLNGVGDWDDLRTRYDIQPIVESDVALSGPIKCTCDIPVLMSVGCACGAFKREMELKKEKQNGQAKARV
jgi:hypothetical protein